MPVEAERVDIGLVGRIRLRRVFERNDKTAQQQTLDREEHNRAHRSVVPHVRDERPVAFANLMIKFWSLSWSLVARGIGEKPATRGDG